MSLDGRITSLEAGMASMRIDLAVVRSNYATKEDVDAVKLDLAVIRSNYVPREEFQKTINTLTWKMYGFGTFLVTVVFFIAKNVN
jgi:hypothetical protein